MNLGWFRCRGVPFSSVGIPFGSGPFSCRSCTFHPLLGMCRVGSVLHHSFHRSSGSSDHQVLAEVVGVYFCLVCSVVCYAQRACQQCCLCLNSSPLAVLRLLLVSSQVGLFLQEDVTFVDCVSSNLFGLDAKDKGVAENSISRLWDSRI